MRLARVLTANAGRLLTPASAAAACLLAAVGCASGAKSPTAPPPTTTPARLSPSAPAAVSSRLRSLTHHYEYVFNIGTAYVYDMDHGQRLVQRISLPERQAIRGVVANVPTHTLYVAYGGDGGSHGDGGLLAYDLVSRRVKWRREYPFGIDSPAVSGDGSRIYMPSGELDESGIWRILDARSGSVLGEIHAGAGAHNTVMSVNGSRVYLGGRNYDYLLVANTHTNKIVERVGPLRSGVRPFTINGRQTLAFTTATGFLGFQVSSLITGRVLYTMSFPGFGWDPSSFAPSAPSHGISLSPDEREVWVMDAPNSYVHVFDVSGLPDRRPRLLANVRLSQPMSGEEQPCDYDCARDGWIQHSRDGRFVYVGDSGDVIDAHSFRVIAELAPLRNSREMLEIDWRSGRPVAATPREGLGYVGV